MQKFTTGQKVVTAIALIVLGYLLLVNLGYIKSIDLNPSSVPESSKVVSS